MTWNRKGRNRISLGIARGNRSKTPIVVTSAAVLSAALGLLAGTAGQALAAPAAALPTTVRHQAAKAEQCQIWRRNYESSNNANQWLKDNVCWNDDSQTVRITSTAGGDNQSEPNSTCTLSTSQTSCTTSTWVNSSFVADFSSKQVTETSRACNHGDCVPEQHIYNFQ
ncbi:hypothetical protein ACIBJI_40035 [Nocardia sp. NPDC050408]|uniref:hypothetical protein n=1 Tax=Nocardia sp. NPDC050408 TaxID=3364319 RepID=UPI003793BFFD